MNRVGIVVLAMLVAAGAALLVLSSQQDDSRQPSPSPERAIAVTQVQHTSPEPTFVGRDVCKECHAENYRLHGNHGHKSTFATTRDPEIIKMFAGRTYDAGPPYGVYTYHADEDGLFVRIPERFGDEPFRLQYALGSIHGGVTLISLIPDGQQGTAVIEHRASWFRSTDELGPTPGQESSPPETLGEFFGRKHQGNVMRKCVYCHTTRGEIVGGQIVDLVANVNCEKCHGPASEHVRQARTMRVPPKFSVGRDDWDSESEIQLCGDCHRLPTAVSRKTLREYPDEMARFQPVGLLRSRCFIESNGKLKCTTCHDPHTTTSAVSAVEHQQNCIDCHREDSPMHVACPVSPKQGCIDCHMPAIEIEGLGRGFHDHWIRVLPQE